MATTNVSKDLDDEYYANPTPREYHEQLNSRHRPKTGRAGHSLGQGACIMQPSAAISQTGMSASTNE